MLLQEEHGPLVRKRSKESKKIFLEQKYSKSIIEAGILKSKEIPLEVLRQQKATKMRNYSFRYYVQSNNAKVLLIIKQFFDFFQCSKLKSNIFQKNKLDNYMSQAPNLGLLLCRSKFESQHKNLEVENCGKYCISCPYH